MNEMGNWAEVHSWRNSFLKNPYFNCWENFSLLSPSALDEFRLEKLDGFGFLDFWTFPVRILSMEQMAVEFLKTSSWSSDQNTIYKFTQWHAYIFDHFHRFVNSWIRKFACMVWKGKVHIFWEGHKILRNLHCIFVYL